MYPPAAEDILNALAQVYQSWQYSCSTINLYPFAYKEVWHEMEIVVEVNKENEVRRGVR